MSSFDINMFIRLQDNNYTPGQTTLVLMLTSVLFLSMLGIVYIFSCRLLIFFQDLLFHNILSGTVLE